MVTGRRELPAGSVVDLAYGRGTLPLRLPRSADVIEPVPAPPLADERGALLDALRRPPAGPPLRALVPAGARVGISVCDVTRPFPAARILPLLLDELEAAGAARPIVFIATGTHRACTAAELEAMLGRAVLGRCAVVQHDAFDRARHRQVGTVPGSDVPALIEAGFLDADVRISTGFIEPHFFAGFSGGPKMVAPGLAAIETVLELHSAARIGHLAATWATTEGNPVHDAVRAIAGDVGIHFNLDVTLDAAHRLTGVFAGSLAESHAAGCHHAGKTATVPVDHAYDVVVSTNGGYPLDQNLYQSVKGMSAAAKIVRPGGAILIASECSDGIPAHGRYGELLGRSEGPAAYLEELAAQSVPEHDQWQVQVQALIQRRAQVFVHSDGLTPEQIRGAWLKPAPDLASQLDAAVERAGAAATIAILPQGPQTIPLLATGVPS